MAITIRDMTQYRWTSELPRALWKAIKTSRSSNLPDWTYEQLVANGWSILAPNRFDVDLQHRDGSKVRFRMRINGQEMPHVQAIFCYMVGLPKYNGYTADEVTEIFNELRLKFPQLPVEQIGSQIRVNWAEQINASHPAFWGSVNPPRRVIEGMVSSEQYVKNVMGADHPRRFQIN